MQLLDKHPELAIVLKPILATRCILRRGSFVSKQFGDWLSQELAARKTSAYALASVSGIGAHAISRMKNGKSAPGSAALEVVKALGFSEGKAEEILTSFGFKRQSPNPSGRNRADWEHLCIALRLLGNYRSVEEALKVAICRESAAQKQVQPQVSR